MNNVTGVSQGVKHTLLLTRSEVTGLLGIDECIVAVEEAFRLYGEGRVAPPGILGISSQDGGFHIKAGLFGKYFVVKSNGNFPQNPARFGLPSIQGIIILCDGENGYPLAVMDSIEITILRTAAATAVAARHLARADAGSLAICGCGNQGRAQLRALARVRTLRRVSVFDKDEKQARHFAADLSPELGIEIQVAADPESAVCDCDLIVTCTPSRKFYLRKEDVAPGAFLAAVGADSEGKQEIDPRLLAGSKVVVDVLEQCATIGELHHAIREGLMARTDVYAELGELAAGKKPGRQSPAEITIFDSTGTALQDAAAAAAVYEKALATGKGARLDFAA